VFDLELEFLAVLPDYLALRSWKGGGCDYPFTRYEFLHAHLRPSGRGLSRPRLAGRIILLSVAVSTLVFGVMPFLYQDP